MLSKEEKLKRLKAACDRGKHDFDALIEECRTGESQFWEIDNAVAVTTLMVSGRHRICYVTVVAGTIKGVIELRPIIEKFARDQACGAIRTVGRLGFEKYAGEIDPDAVPIGIMYEKVLTDGT